NKLTIPTVQGNPSHSTALHCDLGAESIQSSIGLQQERITQTQTSLSKQTSPHARPQNGIAPERNEILPQPPLEPR
ncbi:hypothetical protein, partial [Schlesneria sp.]|uniref:hypothetical protein n=1 Tax=Schlesneria sp. TaxID=2762018 RepID=UPI002EE95CE1